MPDETTPSATPSSTGSSSTSSSSTAPSSTAPSSTAPSSTAPSSTAPSSTEPLFSFDAPLGAPEPVEAPRPSPRALTLSVGMLVTAVLLALLVILPTPYAVSSPGPTRDVLGSQDGTEIIQISGADTYESTGELRLTTVSATGGPGFPSSALGVLEGWISPWTVVQPAEQIFPPDEGREEIDEENAQQMVSSQENASVAALTELGYDVPATLVVAGTVEGSDAEGKLEDGDVILEIDGEPVPDYQTLIRILEEVEPGATVELTVHRRGEDVTVPVVTGEKDDGSAQIGVYIDPQFDMPVDIVIDAGEIGGPSAGTMFALGIVDKLTQEDEADGVNIAGTGTIDVTGDVGPIGGIRQKLAGAVRDGATWFLAPAENCDQVVGHVPDGLRVVSIGTLHDARLAITAIGAGEADDLPTCEEPVEG